MILKSITVHFIDKEQSGTAVIKPRASVLPLSQELSDFISDIKKTYDKKPGKKWGAFDGDTTEFPYQIMVKKYLEVDYDFHDFSVKAVTHLKGLMNAIHQSTGGYVVFAHFDEEEDEYLATLMLNNKRLYNIDDESLLIKQIKGLDIDKIAVANFLNITKWNAEEESYLTFTRGKKGISDYFLRFIGCTDNRDSKAQSSALKLAVKDYLDTLEIDPEEIHNLRNSVSNYCDSQIKKGEDISLHHISSMVNQDSPEAFKEFASSDKYMVSDMIKGHSDILKGLRYYKYRAKNLKIEFDDKMLQDKIVEYVKGRNELIIREVPKALVDQLPEYLK